MAENPPERTRSMSLGIVIRRAPGVTRWARWSWRVVAVLPGAGPADWQELRRDGEAAEYHLATLPLELHRADAEAYDANLSTRSPAIWVALRPSDDDARPYRAHVVTASPYEAQDLMDSGEELVEAVPMSEGLLAWVRDFTELHFREEQFKKRRRVDLDLDQVESGKGDPRIRQDADVYRAPGVAKRRRDDA